MTGFEDRDGVIWLDGKMVPWREARVHVLTHALHYGSSVFEGERAYNGRIFKLREHTARLFKSAELLGFTIPYSTAEIEEACKAVVKENKISNGYIRPLAWLGPETMGVATKGAKVHAAVAAWDWPSYYGKEAREQGLRLTHSKWARPAPNTAPTASKAAGLYMIASLSKDMAERDGFNDAMMLDWRGYVAETSSANLFFVFNGELHTPTPDCFLDGITRRTVMDLARKRGITVIERHIKPEELARASEAFLTGTAAEVTPIREIGEYKFAVGPVVKQLMADYHELVNS